MCLLFLLYKVFENRRGERLIFPQKNYRSRRERNRKIMGFSVIFLLNILKNGLFSEGN